MSSAQVDGKKTANVSLSTERGYLCSSDVGEVRGGLPCLWSQWLVVTLQARFVSFADINNKVLRSDADGRVFSVKTNSKDTVMDNTQVWSLVPVKSKRGYNYLRNEASGLFLSVRKLDNAAECVPEEALHEANNTCELIISFPVVAGELRKKGGGFRGLRSWSTYYWSFNDLFLGYWKSRRDHNLNHQPVAQYAKENIVKVTTHDDDALRLDIVVTHAAIVKGQQIQEEIELELKAETELDMRMWLRAFDTAKVTVLSKGSPQDLATHAKPTTAAAATSSPSDNKKVEAKEDTQKETTATTENKGGETEVKKTEEEGGDKKEELVDVPETEKVADATNTAAPEQVKPNDEAKTVTLAAESQGDGATKKDAKESKSGGESKQLTMGAATYALPSEVPTNPFTLLTTITTQPGLLLRFDGTPCLEDLSASGRDGVYYAPARHNPKQITVRESVIFIDAKKKALYWLDRGKTNVKENMRVKDYNSFLLSDILTIRVGKPADVPALAGWQARAVNELFCFTVYTSKRAFSFSLLSALAVSEILFCIHTVLGVSRYSVGSKSKTKVTSTVYARTVPVVTYHDVTNDMAALSLRDGVKLAVLTQGSKSTKPAFVFTEPESAQSLFWVDAQATLRSAAKQTLTLSDVLDICVGNVAGPSTNINMATTYLSENENVDADSIVQILMKDHTQSVLLITSSPLVADFLVESFQVLFSTQGLKLQAS